MISEPEQLPSKVETLETRFASLQSLLTRYQQPLTKGLLFFFILAYILYFSWYTINRHNTLNSYAADLSLIDQPMWNTALGPGGFMEQTWGNQQQPRLAEHFEPILIPLSALFFIWDDVRILLIAQSIALALGALPVFWIAKKQLTIRFDTSTSNDERQTTQDEGVQPPDPEFQTKNPKPKIQNLKSKTYPWAALVFALVYLLYPHLQAANIADFHADPFVVAPLLFAFWYAINRRWHWMWLWAIIAMLTKENLPTLTAMLGLFLILDHLRPKHQTYIPRPTSHIPHPTSQAPVSQGILLITLSTAWFLIATFLIVSPLAQQHFGSDGPIYLSNRFEGGLPGLIPPLAEPARWHYIVGLLAAVGFLPLLAPEMLILGLPVLVANFFSNFSGQYSGEQHYSAPLVVAFIIASIYSTQRLINNLSLREINGRPLKISVLIAACLWLTAWALAYHTLHGWTPISLRTEQYIMSPTATQLPNLVSHIPAEAIVSASPGLHPHIAHRQVAYLFPTIEEAEYLLLDVTDLSGTHPSDVYTNVMSLLTDGWSLLQTEHGLILAHKSGQTTEFSDNFFDFARATTAPTYTTPLTFGDSQLRLLGYDMHDDPDDGVVFRFYWQAETALPNNLRLWPLIYNDQGQLLSNPVQVPMIATVWYPPGQWQPGEVIVTETLPQLLPNTFHLGLAVGHTANSLHNIEQRLPLTTNAKPQPGHWQHLASFKRHGPFLSHLPPTNPPLIPAEAHFGPTLHLTGYALPGPPQADSLPVILQWATNQPLPTDFTVFVHLLNSAGNLVAQNDAYPHWLTVQPTSHWTPDQLILDKHTLQLPENLPSGLYTINVGLYDAQTSKRLTLPEGSNVLELTQIHIE